MPYIYIILLADALLVANPFTFGRTCAVWVVQICICSFPLPLLWFVFTGSCASKSQIESFHRYSTIFPRQPCCAFLCLVYCTWDQFVMMLSQAVQTVGREFTTALSCQRSHETERAGWTSSKRLKNSPIKSSVYMPCPMKDSGAVNKKCCIMFRVHRCLVSLLWNVNWSLFPKKHLMEVKGFALVVKNFIKCVHVRTVLWFWLNILVQSFQPQRKGLHSHHLEPAALVSMLTCWTKLLISS